MSGSEVIVPVWGASDGVHVLPTNQSLHRDDNHYRHHLAMLWFKHAGGTREDTTFKLNQLPIGYSGWERTRQYPDGRRHVDRYLYGHPSGKRFDSLPKALTHFQHWLEFGHSNGCPCVLCGGRTFTAAPEVEQENNAAVMNIDFSKLDKTTPYSILGLGLNATSDQINQAYTNRFLFVDIESDDPTSYGHRSLIALSRAKEILEDERPIGRQLLNRCIRCAKEGQGKDEPWEFLGLARDASEEQIETAYQACMANWSEYEKLAPMVLHCIEAAREAMLRALS
ncbi:hypothetical protein CB0940_08268 [Cercospora beticola]|uniref:Cryptic loci regulator 2 N-terminal domain-containing protein n=1 Tax=Cercospora beticola TaxID=122368 RepID=A0A2G5HQS3_CERBT|nr:hypothetical protein CB0940_08268 [Cercospora beticola]PIA94896.1 hypothetical protein CB0940_08268 [Cercospora beticola]WPB04836.1 hypothetical protein RHO25_009483 [Cercospora beticola]